MTQHDELLARLDTVGPEEILRDISAHYALVDQAAAAIRSLTAKLEAERKAREEAQKHARQMENLLMICADEFNIRAKKDRSITKICKKCGTSWSGYVTPDVCPHCDAPFELTDWHGLYLGMEALAETQQQRATAAESRLAAVFERTRERCARKIENSGMKDCHMAAAIIRLVAPEESAQPSGSDSPK